MGGIAALLGLASFAFYLYGAYPSVSVGDSGEFITAAYTLGVAHPPGFPLYALLGHLFSLLIPWGNLAYRLNLFSAAAAASSVALFFFALRRANVQSGLAAGSALVLALSTALTANARASEVFALNTLFVMAILSAALDARWGLALFLTGLGAANHQIVLLLLPVLGFALLLNQARPIAERVRQVFYGVLFFGAGVALYAALILRATHHPFLDVGHPDTLQGLWRVIRRADYGSLTLALGEAPARSVKNTLLQLNRLFTGMAHQCTWILLIAALTGLGGTSEHARRLVRLSVGSVLLLGPFFFLLGNLPFDAQSNGLLERFMIAPSVAALFLSVLGLQALSRENRWVAAALLVTALSWQAAHAAWRGFRQDYTAYAYGRNNLRSLPPHARLFMDGGDDTFYTLAYLTQVEGLRPDIHLHDRGGVVFAHPYGPDFRGLDRDAKEERRRQVETTCLQAGEPVYYSTMNAEILPGAQLVQEGVLYAARAGAGSAVLDLWPFYDLRGIPPWDAPVASLRNDYRTFALAPYYAYQKAIALARAGQLDTAWRFLKTAHALGPQVLWLTPNILNTAHLWAYQAFNRGQYPAARDLYRWILTINPEDATARQNLQITENQLRHAAL